MKKLLLSIAMTTMLLACQKEAQQIPSQKTTAQEEFRVGVPAGYESTVCGSAYETPIMAGQSINVGSVTVWNDDVNVYVSYQTTGNYLLKKTHLFVGACNAIPTNNSGNPRIGQYPFTMDHGTGVAIKTYIIARSSLPVG